jgi:hypothetical protein|tara:strand:- start:27 stop:785 length:759 start_codon:yes stop_codon:yes gene_type:complete
MKKIILLILGCSLIFTACKKDTSNMQLTTNLTINFIQTVDGTSLTNPDHPTINTMIYTNAAGEDYSIQTLKYLISDITLHADDGNTLLLDEVHFIDISDSSTFSFTYQNVANNNYTSISFDMGLDSSKNSSNFYVNEDFHSTMFWPEPNGGGYHYMKLEGAYTNDSTFYNTHTGGTMGGDYSFNNSSSISLNVNNDMGDVIIDINMEINNWYQNPNPIAFSSYGMGIMMNMEKQMQLQANGRLDVFSVTASQ